MKETISLNPILVEGETDNKENQVKKVIEAAVKSLWFPSIFEDGYGKTEYGEEDYFQKADGAVLIRRLDLYSGEFYYQIVNGDVDFSVEIYLTDEFEPLLIYTIRVSHCCQECQETHTRLHRMVVKDLTSMKADLDVMLNFITVDL